MYHEGLKRGEHDKKKSFCIKNITPQNSRNFFIPLILFNSYFYFFFYLSNERVARDKPKHIMTYEHPKKNTGNIFLCKYNRCAIARKLGSHSITVNSVASILNSSLAFKTKMVGTRIPQCPTKALKLIH